MRRLLGLVVVAALLVPALAALAGTESVSDDFSEGNYSGNDGSLDWAGPWIEIDESDGPGKGKVRVGDQNCSNNNCLRMSGAGLVTPVRVKRAADLHTFSSATLEFDRYIDAASVSTGTLEVQARSGTPLWTTLKSYVFLRDKGQHSESIDVSLFTGSDFELRFLLTGLLGDDVVYIDKVNIEGTVQATTTSTTSTTSSTTSTSTSSTTSTSTSTTSSTTTTTKQSSGVSPTSTTTTVPSAAGSNIEGETTTTVAGTTSTTGPATVAVPPIGPPFDGGLRQPAVGLMADYRSGMMGDLDMGEVEVLGAELEADFSLAVEAFGATKIWIALLALLIAVAVVSGMDRRQSKADPTG